MKKWIDLIEDSVCWNTENNIKSCLHKNGDANKRFFELRAEYGFTRYNK
jgi:hypothetical protein